VLDCQHTLDARYKTKKICDPASLVFAAWIAGGLLSMCGYAVA
jgi:hypothetical protein